MARIPEELKGLPAFCVRRPVFAIVMNLLVIIAGLAAILAVEVRELPSTDRPVVTIRTAYSGATPETVETGVTTVLEGAAARVPGVASISSVSDYGSSRITVEFSPAVDLDTAATDLRDAIGAVQRDLPETAETPIVIKANDDDSAILRLAATTDSLPIETLTQIVDNQIVDRLTAVPGVGDVTLFGERQPVFSIALDRMAMASRGLAPDDIRDTIERVTADTPAGSLVSGGSELLVRTEINVGTVDDINALRIDGATRLGDIAAVSYGPDERTSYLRADGKTGIGINIIRQAQSNTLDISQGVADVVASLQPLLPDDVDLRITTDDAVFIGAAIGEVVKSLLIATAIVVAVMFVFLRRAVRHHHPGRHHSGGADRHGGGHLACRLFAQHPDAARLAAGNRSRRRRCHRRTGKHHPLPQSRRGSPGGGGARHPRGVFRRAGNNRNTCRRVHSDLLSARNRRAAFFGVRLRSRHRRRHLVLRRADAGADAGVAADRSGGGAHTQELAGAHRPCLCRGLSAPAAHGLAAPLVVLVISIIFSAFSYHLFTVLPQEITPREDRAVIPISVMLAQGTELEAANDKMQQIEAVGLELMETGEAESMFSIIGWNAANRGFVVFRLAPWGERERDQSAIVAEVNRKLANIPGVTAFARQPNTLGLRGGGTGLRFALTGPDYDLLSDAADELTAAMRDRFAGLGSFDIGYDTTQAQLSVQVDRDRARELGIDLGDISSFIAIALDAARSRRSMKTTPPFPSNCRLATRRSTIRAIWRICSSASATAAWWRCLRWSISKTRQWRRG